MGSDCLAPWVMADATRDGGLASPLAVATIDGRSRPSDRTFIVVQGIRAWIESFEMRRFQLIAGRLRIRLVVVEVPGFGAAGTRLLTDERCALLTGVFGPLATRMLDAALRVIGGQGMQRLSFLGYSMGASIATAMASCATRRGIGVEHLCLVEPVAMQRWRIGELVAATRAEGHQIERYLEANGAVAGAVLPWDRRGGTGPATHRRRDLLLLGAALSRGGLGKELLASGSPHLVIVRGDRSSLSQGDLSPTVHQLRAAGVVTDELVVPGHHAFWHSLPAVDEMCRRLQGFLSDKD